MVGNVKLPLSVADMRQSDILPPHVCAVYPGWSRCPAQRKLIQVYVLKVDARIRVRADYVIAHRREGEDCYLVPHPGKLGRPVPSSSGLASPERIALEGGEQDSHGVYLAVIWRPALGSCRAGRNSGDALAPCAMDETVMLLLGRASRAGFRCAGRCGHGHWPRTGLPRPPRRP